MEKHVLYGSKLCMAMRKLPEELIPFIIGYILRHYGRYGLAAIVERAWYWRDENV